MKISWPCFLRQIFRKGGLGSKVIKFLLLMLLIQLAKWLPKYLKWVHVSTTKQKVCASVSSQKNWVLLFFVITSLQQVKEWFLNSKYYSLLPTCWKLSLILWVLSQDLWVCPRYRARDQKLIVISSIARHRRGKLEFCAGWGRVGRPEVAGVRGKGLHHSKRTEHLEDWGR